MSALPRGSRLGWFVVLLGLPIPVLVAFGLHARSTLTEPPSTGASCSSAEVAQRAAYLVDLRKPLDLAFESLPGELLDAVTKRLPADTELGVYTLSPYEEAPRTLIGRLCKPYDNGTLVVESAKNHRSGEGDCGDLPAQIPAKLRDSATQFCRQREQLRGRIDALAAEHRRLATDAYLVEAVEETWRDFANSTVPTSLYVFSDMMQHAAWYSHLDAQWTGWDAESFEAARRTRLPLPGPVPSAGEGFAVTVFYVARAGLTDTPQSRLDHQHFWTGFFGADAETSFENQTTMSDYAAEPRMNVATPAELAAYELERARHLSELATRERAELERSQRALAQREDQLEAQQRRLEESRQRLAAEQREFELRAGEARESNPELAAEPDGPGG